jgi:hypothetical protein
MLEPLIRRRTHAAHAEPMVPGRVNTKFGGLARRMPILEDRHAGVAQQASSAAGAMKARGASCGIERSGAAPWVTPMKSGRPVASDEVATFIVVMSPAEKPIMPIRAASMP